MNRTPRSSRLPTPCSTRPIISGLKKHLKAALSILGLLVFTVSASAASYHLKEKAVVDGPVIHLRDVLEPLPPADLGEVVVGRLGKPGSSRTISRDQVLARMRKYLKA